ncbi:MAG TPA: DUF362 domain-containing protein [Planctomycetota bacterium]|nr:DUF362 domain-containing protein [Planctomycetota bacterium]HRR79139.1 DUF362 domain-containing protein [Planctomycetota bacterium]HRT97294.1 DUF362 domain-containing protein [Planctomycetota bacterium]
MNTVAVVQSGADHSSALHRVLALAEADDVMRPGDSVLIKPNLHAAQHWTTAGTTNPALVVALIEWARARGAGRIVVADGSYYGTPKPEQVFVDTGMAAAVEAAGAEWAAMPSHGYRVFANASPLLPPETGISQFVFECDRLINVAVMKTHIDCLVTLGMKNLKGCIRNEDKRAFHNDLDINRALVALNRLITPDLTIVDGTLGMEGIGPHAGRPANFGHIFASRHTPSVDAVAASAMGVEIAEARTLQYAFEEGLLDPAAIRVVGVPVETIRRRFERPYEAMMRELPGLRLQMTTACSACKLNVIRALRENRQAGISLPGRPIAIGKVVGEGSAPREPDAILIGRCAAEHAVGHRYLPGCPPSVARIKDFLATVCS